MSWFTVYLVTCLVIPTIYGMASIEEHDKDTHVTIKHPVESIAVGLFALLWPIAIPLDIVSRIKENFKKNTTSRAKDILGEYGFSDRGERSRNRDGDLSFLVNMSESDLKTVMLAYRRKWISLSSQNFEMIRNELMNRNAERDLLK